MKKLEKLKITQITIFIILIGLLSTIFIQKLIYFNRPITPILDVLPFIIISFLLIGMAIITSIILGSRITKSKRRNEDVHDYYILSKYILQQTKINGVSAIACLGLVIFMYNPLLFFISFLSVLWYIYSVFTWKI